MNFAKIFRFIFLACIYGVPCLAILASFWSIYQHEYINSSLLAGLGLYGAMQAKETWGRLKPLNQYTEDDVEIVKSFSQLAAIVVFIFLLVGTPIYLLNDLKQEGASIGLLSAVSERPIGDYVRLSGNDEFILKDGTKYKVTLKETESGKIGFISVVEIALSGKQRVVFSTNPIRTDLPANGWYDDKAKDRVMNFVTNELYKLRN